MFWCLVLVSVGLNLTAATLNTQIPPFTIPGGATLTTTLSPQTTAVRGVGSFAGVEFGFNELDAATRILDTGILSAATGGSWSAFPTAQGFASSVNGTLKASAAVAGTVPDQVGAVQVHSFAGFQDALTISSASLASDTPAYLHLLLSVTGALLCDTDICPTGLLFGYAPGTIGRSDRIHQIGGERPAPTNQFSTMQHLVPLPFLMGKPFNMALNIDTSPRITRPLGNTFATSDLTHTVRISGISVTDAQGNPIADWTISSASGLTYASDGVSAIPEPGSILMVASAGLLLAMYSRKRKTRVNRPSATLET